MNSLNARDLDSLTTEQRNSASGDIDSLDSLGIVRIINQEDMKVAPAVEKILPQIALLVDDVVRSFKQGGRLFYIGAGTSGRLGVLDASECPPTYGVDPSMVQGLIAGGMEALTRSIESAEDRSNEGVEELRERGFCSKDVLVGITASGQAPYVLGALEYASSLGASTGAISCNRESRTFSVARHPLFVDVGPEVVTGSTRMKSGSAQKMVLNMISTASMIRLGKVYKNLMVDLKPVNHKLILRSCRLIREVTGCGEEEARELFEASGREPKTAMVMRLLQVDRDEARKLLEGAEGHISALIKK